MVHLRITDWAIFSTSELHLDDVISAITAKSAHLPRKTVFQAITAWRIRIMRGAMSRAMSRNL